MKEAIETLIKSQYNDDLVNNYGEKYVIIKHINQFLLNIDDNYLREKMFEMMKKILVDILIYNKRRNVKIQDEDVLGIRIDSFNLLKTIKKYRKQFREELNSSKYFFQIEDKLDELELFILDFYNNKHEIFLNFEFVAEIEGSIVIIYDNEKVYYLNRKAMEFFQNRISDVNNKIEDLFAEMIELNEFYNSSNNILEHKIKNKNDEEVWLELKMSPLNLLNKKVHIAIINDISRRKKIEEELKESEEKYRILLEMLPDAVYVLENNCIEYANNAALEMLGADKIDDVLGKNSLEFLRVPYEHQSLVQQQNDILKRTKRLLPVERKYRRQKDNKMLDIETTAAIVKTGDTELTINIGRDIEARKKVENLKKRVQEKTLKLKEAQKYDELRSEFFANISHEFRTPINVILGVVQLLDKLHSDGEEYNQKAKFGQYMDITKQNCYRLIRLVNNLIDMTKIDAGYMKLSLGKFNIINLVEDICMSVAEYMRSKGIELIFDTEIEEKYIYIDPDKIERIVLNLLSNSIKFTNPGGKVLVNMYVQDNKVGISIADTGIGIPKEKQKVIFNRFIQVEKTLSRNREGSGIGLSLVKAFVEMHEGTLELKSEIGKGSEFIIELPMDIKPQEHTQIKHDHKQSINIESINIEFSDIYS